MNVFNLLNYIELYAVEPCRLPWQASACLSFCHWHLSELWLDGILPVRQITRAVLMLYRELSRRRNGNF